MQTDRVEVPGHGPRRRAMGLGAKLSAGFAFLTLLSMGIAGITLERMQAMDRATRRGARQLPAEHAGRSQPRRGGRRRPPVGSLLHPDPAVGVQRAPAGRGQAARLLRGTRCGPQGLRLEHRSGGGTPSVRHRLRQGLARLPAGRPSRRSPTRTPTRRRRPANPTTAGPRPTSRRWAGFVSWDLGYNHKHGLEAGQRSRDVYDATWWDGSWSAA